MILPSPTDLPGKIDTGMRESPVARSPPPVHPNIQYGASSPATPPEYLTTRRPTSSITYTFCPQTSPPNTMVLTSPSYFSAPQEPYYISVSMNCFTPSSYITTIKRNSWDGPFVGDFEMGPKNAKKPGTLCIRGNEHPITEILDSNTRLFRNTWTWRTSEHDKATTLFWDDSAGAGILTCFSSKDKVITNLLAKFMPPSHPRRQGRQTELTRLEVSPQGHEVFDDILMSVLIIERLRTLPSSTL